MVAKTSRLKGVTLSVALAITGVGLGLSSPADAFMLLASSEATASPYSAPSSNVYSSTSKTDRVIIKYRDAAAQKSCKPQPSESVEPVPWWFWPVFSDLCRGY